MERTDQSAPVAIQAITSKIILRKPFLRLLGYCSLPLILSPLSHYLAIASFGSQIFLWLQLPLILPVLPALIALVVSPFLLLVRRTRPLAWRAFVAAGILVVATAGGILLGQKVRMVAFHSLAERSAPLVQAIRAYEARHHTPPADLTKLVPEFIPAVPTTGMAAYPRYEYQVGEKAVRYDNNPWVLVVQTPSGGINWDQFLYFPLQNYPQRGYGGGLQRIADWAYVHE